MGTRDRPPQRVIGTTKAIIDKIEAVGDKVVTLSSTELTRLIDDAFQEGYNAGHFDHGQAWGDRRELRQDDLRVGKTINQTEDDHPELNRGR